MDGRRDSWCATRKVGDKVAVFFPGDTLLCPGTRFREGDTAGVVCGSPLLEHRNHVQAKAGTQVVVRVITNGFPKSKSVGFDAVCRRCRSALEILPILEATG